MRRASAEPRQAGTTWDATGSASTSAAPSPTSACSTRRPASSPASSPRPCPAIPAAACSTGLRALVSERGLDPGDIGYLVHGDHDRRQHGDPAERRHAGPPGHRRVRRRARDPAAPPRQPGQLHGDAPRAAHPALSRRRGDRAHPGRRHAWTPRSTGRSFFARRLRLVEREGAEALVVSFINAYRTPAHEAEAKKVLAERFPKLHVTCSHEVWPQIREYERTMVAILSAYVRPKVRRLPRGASSRSWGRLACGVPLYITKSNGGVTTARDARRATAETMLSGPASGVIGATAVCVRAGYRDLITFDMGGTSADIALVRGRPAACTPPTRRSGSSRSSCRSSACRRSARAAARSRGWIRSGVPQGRAAERGRRPGAGVLRPGRRRADPVRRLPPLRLPQPRQLRRRAAPAPPRRGRRRRCGRSPTASISASTPPRRR